MYLPFSSISTCCLSSLSIWKISGTGSGLRDVIIGKGRRERRKEDEREDKTRRGSKETKERDLSFLDAIYSRLPDDDDDDPDEEDTIIILLPGCLVIQKQLWEKEKV